MTDEVCPECDTKTVQAWTNRMVKAEEAATRPASEFRLCPGCGWNNFVAIRGR